MNYFLITPQGEDGPYETAELDRMYLQGKVRGDTKCRSEDETVARRLDEVFPHMTGATAGNVRPQQAAGFPLSARIYSAILVLLAFGVGSFVANAAGFAGLKRTFVAVGVTAGIVLLEMTIVRFFKRRRS